MSCSKSSYLANTGLLHDIFNYMYIMPAKQEYDESGIRRNSNTTNQEQTHFGNHLDYTVCNCKVKTELPTHFKSCSDKR